MQKFNKSAIVGIQKHNQREAKESKNEDINKEQTPLNYDLINEQNISYMKEIRKMTDERVSRKVRDNAVLDAEFFISASPEYMQSLSEQEEEDYFQAALDHLKDKYGEQNLLYATVHKDEATPHMHVGVVPITDDGRLSAKDYFHGKAKIKAIQDDFHEHMNERGFPIQRGEASEKQHKDVHEFKQEQRLKERNQAVEEYNTIKGYLKDIQEMESVKLKEYAAERKPVHRIPLESAEPKKFMNQILIHKDEFEEVKSYIKDMADDLERAYEVNADLEQRVERKDEEFQKAESNNFRLRAENAKLLKHQEKQVEEAKAKMRKKLEKDFTTEQKEELRKEVSKTVMKKAKSYIKDVEEENKELKRDYNKVVATNKDLKGQLEAKDEKISDIVDEANSKLSKLNTERKQLKKDLKEYTNPIEAQALRKENNILRNENKELQGWKDRMIDWAKETLSKIPKIAESFYRAAGMTKEAEKYEEDEMER